MLFLASLVSVHWRFNWVLPQGRDLPQPRNVNAVYAFEYISGSVEYMAVDSTSLWTVLLICQGNFLSQITKRLSWNYVLYQYQWITIKQEGYNNLEADE